MRFSPKTRSNDKKHCFNENICELVKLEFHKIYFRNHYRIVVIATFFFKDAVIILEPNEISHQNKLSLEKKWCLKEEGILLLVWYYSFFFPNIMYFIVLWFLFFQQTNTNLCTKPCLGESVTDCLLTVLTLCYSFCLIKSTSIGKSNLLQLVSQGSRLGTWLWE